MSRKGFILTALVLNLIICLSICVMKFATDDSSKSKETKSELNSYDEMIEAETTTMSVEELYTSDFTVEDTDEETSKKIVEQQVSKESTSDMEQMRPEETTSQPETPAIVVNGTVAVVNNSCNIRASKDVGGNIIGTANAGNTYTIDAALCTDNWIAILYDGQTVGYISSGFCTIQ